MFFTLISLLFGAFIWGVFVIGALIVALGLIEVFVRVVRIWKPHFFESYQERANRQTTQTDKSERRLLAIDYLIQERIRRQTEARKQLHAEMFGTKPQKSEPQPLLKAKSPTVLPDEVTLDELNELVTSVNVESIEEQIASAIRAAEDRANDPAEYSVVRLVNGRKRFLCGKTVRRLDGGEIQNKVLFAPLRDKAMRFDRDSAHRLLTVLPEGCCVEAYNAAARVHERQVSSAAS